jgi:hypothetical protein
VPDGARIRSGSADDRNGRDARERAARRMTQPVTASHWSRPEKRRYMSTVHEDVSLTTTTLAAVETQPHFSFGALHPMLLAEAIVSQSDNLIAGKTVTLVVPPLSQGLNFFGKTFDVTESLTITLVQRTP